MTFKHPANVKYRGKRKIPMATFCQMYLDGDVELNGDTLAILEKRHDWASFRLTFGLIYHVLFKLIPKMVEDLSFHGMFLYTDDDCVHPDYEELDVGLLRGFLGPRMMYTSGIVRDTNNEESQKELENNKLDIICEKIHLNPYDKVLSIGYGWQALANYARRIFPNVPFTGLTHTNEYINIPAIRGGYKKIICTHLAQHKGPGNFMALHTGPGEYSDFLKHIHGLLSNDCIFFLEVAGADKSWQYEDLVWRLLMAKYVCPDAIPYASLGSLTNQLETAGFRVNGADNVGRHYSETVRKWYGNFVWNQEALVAMYGPKVYRASFLA
ncbi:cyclopropane-fatty-acyl-phospholipid synthase [Colletotrichum salicis]|uniref:sphingolipid C(9)-methyltransferase n=1 Tax=Colletotrichum salicis TaxID=1209931 RepID=A0A135SMN8_9PEZI|nr:cyclopropane-fatty-acyl-phospholipid synthase [Colletotrichum salicis]